MGKSKYCSMLHGTGGDINMMMRTAGNSSMSRGEEEIIADVDRRCGGRSTWVPGNSGPSQVG